MVKNLNRRTPLQKSIALTLVGALLISTPGTLGWADDSRSNSTNNRRSSGLPTTYATNSDGRSPNNSYITVGNPREKNDLKAIAFIGEKLAATLPMISQLAMQKYGPSGVQNFLAQNKYVATPHMVVPETIAANSPAGSALSVAQDALKASLPDPVKSPIVGPDKDGYEFLKEKPKSIDDVLNMFGSENNPTDKQLRKATSGNFDALTDQYAKFYESSVLQGLLLQDRISYVNQNIKELNLNNTGLDKQIAAQKEILGRTQIYSGRGTVGTSAASARAAIAKLIADKEANNRKIEEFQFQLTGTKAKPGLTPQLDQKTDLVGKARTLLLSLGDMHITAAKKIPSLMALSDKAQDKFNRLKNSIDFKGIIPEHALLSGEDLKSVKKGDPVVNTIVLVGLLAKMAARYVDKSITAWKGQNKLDALHAKDAEELATLDQKTKALELYLDRSTRGVYQEKDLIDGLNKETALQYAKGIKKVSDYVDQGVNRSKEYASLTDDIKAGVPGARKKLLDLIEKWEGREFLAQWIMLPSNDIASIAAQNEYIKASELFNGLRSDTFLLQEMKSRDLMIADAKRALIANGHFANLPIDPDTKNPDYNRAIYDTIWKRAGKDDAAALALSRKYDLPFFDWRSGEVLKDYSLAMDEKNPASVVARQTQTYRNYETGWYNSYAYFNEKNPLLAGLAAVDQAKADIEAARVESLFNPSANFVSGPMPTAPLSMSEALARTPPSTTGSTVGWMISDAFTAVKNRTTVDLKGTLAIVGTSFDNVLAPLHLAMGVGAVKLGDSLGADSYYGARLKIFGGTEIGNNVFARASGTSAVTEIKNAFGLNRDVELVPTVDADGVKFNTNNSELNSVLSALWTERAVERKMATYGADLLNAATLTTGLKMVGSDAMHDFRDGNGWSGLGKLAAVGAAGSIKVGLEVAAFGGINGAIREGISVGSKLALAARIPEGFVLAVGRGLQVAAVDLPGLQFRWNVGKGFIEGYNAVSAWQAGDYNSAARGFSTALVDSVTTLFGAGAAAGVGAKVANINAIREATALGEPIPAKVSFFGTAARDMGRMAVEGFTIAAGGAFFGSAGALTATVGSGVADFMRPGLEKLGVSQRYGISALNEIASGRVTDPGARVAAAEQIAARMSTMSKQEILRAGIDKRVDMTSGFWASLGRGNSVVEGDLVRQVAGQMLGKRGELPGTAEARGSLPAEYYRNPTPELTRLRVAADRAYDAWRSDVNNPRAKNVYDRAAERLQNALERFNTAQGLHGLLTPPSAFDVAMAGAGVTATTQKIQENNAKNLQAALAHSGVSMAGRDVEALNREASVSVKAGKTAEATLRAAEASLAVARFGKASPEAVAAVEMANRSATQLRTLTATEVFAKANAEVQGHKAIQESIDAAHKVIDQITPPRRIDPESSAWRAAVDRVKAEVSAAYLDGVEAPAHLRDRVVSAARDIAAGGSTVLPESVSRSISDGQARLDVATAQQRAAESQLKLVSASPKEAKALEASIEFAQRGIAAAQARLNVSQADISVARATKFAAGDVNAAEVQIALAGKERAAAAADMRAAEAKLADPSATWSQRRDAKTAIKEAETSLSLSDRHAELAGAQQRVFDRLSVASKTKTAFEATSKAIEDLIAGKEPLSSSVSGKVAELFNESGLSTLGQGGATALTRDAIRAELNRISEEVTANHNRVASDAYAAKLAVKEFNTESTSQGFISDAINRLTYKVARAAAMVPLLGGLVSGNAAAMVESPALFAGTHAEAAGAPQTISPIERIRLELARRASPGESSGDRVELSPQRAKLLFVQGREAIAKSIDFKGALGTEITLVTGKDGKSSLEISDAFAQRLVQTIKDAGAMHREVIGDLLADVYNRLGDAINADGRFGEGFHLEWNDIQKWDTNREVNSGNNVEAAMSGGKSYLGLRATMTRVLTEPVNGGGTLVLRSETAIKQYFEAKYRVLSELFGIELVNLDALAKSGDWAGVVKALENPRAITLTTWTELPQLFNEAMESASPATRQLIQDYLQREVGRHRLTVIDEAHEFLLDNTQAIRGDNGRAAQEFKDRQTSLVAEIRRLVDGGVITRVNGGGELTYERDGHMVIPGPELVEKLSTPRDGSGKHYEFNEIRGALKSALEQEGGKPGTQTVNLERLANGKYRVVPRTDNGGLQPQRILHDKAYLTSKAVLFEEAGYKIDWQATRAGGKTLAASDPFDLFTYLGGEKSLIAGTERQYEVLIKALTGRGVTQKGTLSPEIQMAIENGKSVGLKVFGEGAGRQNLLLRLFTEATREEAFSSFVTASTDHLLERVAREILAKGKPVEGYGQYIGIADVEQRAQQFISDQAAKLAERASRNERFQLKDKNDNVIGEYAVRDLLTHLFGREVSFDAQSIRSALTSAKGGLYTVLNDASIQNPDNVIVAKSSVRDGRIVLTGKVGWVGVSVEGHNLRSLGYGLEANSKTMVEQWLARINRQLRPGVYFEGGIAKLFSSEAEMKDVLTEMQSANGADFARKWGKSNKEALNLLKRFEKDPTSLENPEKLLLALHMNEAIDVSSALNQGADRIFAKVLTNDPSRAFLRALELKHGLDSRVYKAAYEAYRDVILDTALDNGMQYTNGRQNAAQILREKYEAQVTRVKRFEQRIAGSVASGELGTFREVFRTKQLEAVKKNYNSITVKDARDDASMLNARSVRELVAVVKRFEPEILSGISTTSHVPESVVLRQAAEVKANAGLQVTDAEMSRIQGAAIRDVGRLIRIGTPSGRLVAIANASDMAALRTAVFGGSYEAASRAVPASVSADQPIGSFRSTYDNLFTTARTAGYSTTRAALSSAVQAWQTQRPVRISADVAVQSSVNAYLQAEASLARMGKHDRIGGDTAELRDMHLQNLSRWALMNPSAVAKALAGARAGYLVDQAQESAGGAKLDEAKATLKQIAGLASSINAVGKERNAEFNTSWSGKRGQSGVVVRVSQLNPEGGIAEPGLAILSLIHLAKLSNTDLEVQLAKNINRNILISLKNLTKSDKNIRIVDLDDSVSAKVREKASAAIRTGKTVDSPVAMFAAAVSSVDKFLELKAKANAFGSVTTESDEIRDQKRVVQRDLEAFLSVAGLINESIGLELMRRNRLPDSLVALIGELANSKVTTADAEAAMEAYILQSEHEGLANQSIGEQAVPSQVSAVSLPEMPSLIQRMRTHLSNSAKGSREAKIAAMTPGQLSKIGDKIRSKDVEAQKAYEALPNAFERYQADYKLALIAAQRAAARQRRTPYSTSATNWAIAQARSQALGDLFSSVNASLAAIENPRNLPHQIVVPDDMDQASYLALVKNYGARRVMSNLGYQKYLSQRAEIAKNARADAVQALLPKAETVSSAPSAVTSIATNAKLAFKSLLPTLPSSTSFDAEKSAWTMKVAGVAGAIAAMIVALPVLSSHGYVADYSTLLVNHSADNAATYKHAVMPFGWLLMLAAPTWNRVKDTSTAAGRRVAEVLHAA